LSLLCPLLISLLLVFLYLYGFLSCLLAAVLSIPLPILNITDEFKIGFSKTVIVCFNFKHILIVPQLYQNTIYIHIYIFITYYFSRNGKLNKIKNGFVLCFQRFGKVHILNNFKNVELKKYLRKPNANQIVSIIFFMTV